MEILKEPNEHKITFTWQLRGYGQAIGTEKQRWANKTSRIENQIQDSFCKKC